MISNKDFFEQLQEGQEYLNCSMTKEVYNGIDFELRQLMTDPVIYKKNNDFENDETHKKLMIEKSKINKKIMNYEYDVNQKKFNNKNNNL
jgi:hypothetical protein